jgi:hypothetical protein
MNPVLILLFFLSSASLTAAQSGDEDARFISAVNCLDEYHFCFGAKGNVTSMSKRSGCLSDNSCDVIVIADASDVNRIRWNFQVKMPAEPLDESEVMVAFFYLATDKVCNTCEHERSLTAFSKLPSNVPVIEYQLTNKNDKPQARQFVIEENRDNKDKITDGDRQLVEERSGERLFVFSDDVSAPDDYWGIIFTSNRKLKYGKKEVDLLRDPLGPHLVLLHLWYKSGTTKPESVDVITNVGMSKFLIFSDKEDDSEYQAEVRKWTIRIILMLVILLVIAIGCIIYYRCQMKTHTGWKHHSPDSINDAFDQ